MSFQTQAHSPGVFAPGELAMLQALMEEMRGESWFPRSAAMQENFASFILKTYDRGVTCPAKIKRYCSVAATLYYRETESEPASRTAAEQIRVLQG